VARGTEADPLAGDRGGPSRAIAHAARHPDLEQRRAFQPWALLPRRRSLASPGQTPSARDSNRRASPRRHDFVSSGPAGAWTSCATPGRVASRPVLISHDLRHRARWAACRLTARELMRPTSQRSSAVLAHGVHVRDPQAIAPLAFCSIPRRASGTAALSVSCARDEARDRADPEGRLLQPRDDAEAGFSEDLVSCGLCNHGTPKSAPELRGKGASSQNGWLSARRQRPRTTCASRPFGVAQQEPPADTRPAAPRRWEPCSPSIGAAVWVAGPDCFRTAGGSCNRLSAIAAWNARSRWREAFPDAQRTMNVQVAALLPGARTRGVAVPWLSSGSGGARTGARLPRGAGRGGLLAVGRTTRLQAVRRLPLRDEPAAARGPTPTRIWAGGSRR
jgi:hypothetical protein